LARANTRDLKDAPVVRDSARRRSAKTNGRESHGRVARVANGAAQRSRAGRVLPRYGSRRQEAAEDRGIHDESRTRGGWHVLGGTNGRCRRDRRTVLGVLDSNVSQLLLERNGTKLAPSPMERERRLLRARR